jgi:hypothetical protein
MSQHPDEKADQTLAQFFLFLLLQAEIAPSDFCAATEPGRIVITKDPEKSTDDDNGNCHDPIFQATSFILDNADNDSLQNVLHTIQSELAERGLK